MAIVPGFSRDVFVSYAHVNNEPMYRSDEGWITGFIESLRWGLDQKAGRKDLVEIWHDPVLRANDVPDDRIAEALSNTALFIAVLSPAYLASSYCRWELDRFAAGRPADFGPTFDGRSRMFKVLLSYVPRSEQPACLQATEGYPFFERDEITGKERQLRRPSSFEKEPTYSDRMEDVVREVWDTLTAMERRVRNEPAVERKGPVVYLAEVTDDLWEQREQIRRDLDQKGVRVEPDGQFSLQGPGMHADVMSALERSALSVHMISGTAGKPVAGTQKGIACIQYELAAARTTSGPRPVVWLPPDLDVGKITNPAHRELLDSLCGTSGETKAEVLRVGMEELKAILFARLYPKANPAQPALRRRDVEEPMVYISHREEDRSQLLPLQSFFKNANCAVSVLNHSGDSCEVRKRHKTWLRYCDGLVIVYGLAPEAWAEEVAMEARDIAQRRGRPKKLAVVEAPPPGKRQFNLQTKSLVLIDYQNGKQLQGADPFLAALWDQQDV